MTPPVALPRLVAGPIRIAIHRNLVDVVLTLIHVLQHGLPEKASAHQTFKLALALRVGLHVDEDHPFAFSSKPDSPTAKDLTCVYNDRYHLTSDWSLSLCLSMVGFGVLVAPGTLRYSTSHSQCLAFASESNPWSYTMLILFSTAASLPSCGPCPRIGVLISKHGSRPPRGNSSSYVSRSA